MPIQLTTLDELTRLSNHLAARGYDVRYCVGPTGGDPQLHGCLADLLTQVDALTYANKQASKPRLPPNRR